MKYLIIMGCLVIIRKYKMRMNRWEVSHLLNRLCHKFDTFPQVLLKSIQWLLRYYANRQSYIVKRSILNTGLVQPQIMYLKHEGFWPHWSSSDSEKFTVDQVNVVFWWHHPKRGRLLKLNRQAEKCWDSKKSARLAVCWRLREKVTCCCFTRKFLVTWFD